MKIKTSKLTGAALDWVVAKIEVLTGNKHGFHTQDKRAFVRFHGSEEPAYYSTIWSQGGPIIEREGITIVCAEGDYNQSKAGTKDCYDTYWVAVIGRQTADTVYGSQGDNYGNHFQIAEEEMQGPTPLIAAMRCYVGYKLGDEIEVPDELIL